MKISVIMSVYKEPLEWLRQSIDSILNQTYRNFEFIIICDNPYANDNIELLKDYAIKDSRIKLILNAENIGLTRSLNRGLAIARGKYIARMDADDISLPDRFEKQYIFMENHPEVIVLGTNINYIGKGAKFKINESFRYSDAEIRAQMIFDNSLVHPSVLIRRSVLVEHSICYDENYRQSQDYRLWEQLLPYGEFSNLKDKLLHYRISEQQITKSNASGQLNLANSVRIRIQQKWLVSLGVYVTDTELIYNPYKIIEILKGIKGISKTLEFKLFVQFVYLNGTNPPTLRYLLLKGDFKYFSIMNLLRVFKRMIL